MAQLPPAPVLIVDDNAETRDVLERILAFKGYHTVTASDGLDALAYLRGGGTASIIILDVRMPNMDGMTLQRALRADARWASIPVVLFTAFPPSDPEGAVGILRKGSTDPDFLLALVARAYRGAEGRA